MDALERAKAVIREAADRDYDNDTPIWVLDDRSSFTVGDLRELVARESDQ